MVTEDSPSCSQRRILAVAAGLTGLLLVLILQLVRWHVLEHDTIPAALPPRISENPPYPARGNILDRHGQLIATDVFRWDVGVSPGVVKDKEQLARDLAPLLGQSVEDIQKKLTVGPEVQYVPLAADLDQAAGEQIAALKRFGVRAEPHPRRYYPQGELAARVLGFVNLEGKAFYGVEAFYQEFLTGASTLRNVQTSDEPLPATFAPYIPSPIGRDLILTLDLGIQYLVEAELERALEYYGAQAGTVIVLDPKTGEILAMANEPGFDPNRLYEDERTRWANNAISLQYEPGSVVKVITLAAGLDSEAITLNQMFKDPGVLEVGGREIHNSDRRAHGDITLTDILAYSLNVGAAQVSLAMGTDTFYRYLYRFGFGRVTEVDLAGELPGTVKDPNSAEWSESDLATNAYGQGVAVTPLQLITAISFIANDGVAIRPHIVRQMVDHGRVIPVRPRFYQRAIRVETAQQMKKLMVDATARGIDAALVPGYKVAGKTGTAQIPTSSGYREDISIATYVAFLPADDPRVIVLVKLDRPTRSVWASEVAVPVFQRIASELVRMLDIPPDEIRLSRE